jgi:dinuclear metal center YbgI/SA1388 family protein
VTTVARDDVLAWLDAELDVPGYRDYGPNGLQVIGADVVSRVAVAVSSSLDVFERAGAAGAQLLLVHHGLFWDGASPVVDGLRRRRLEALFRHDLTLAAYHLPLDAHAELGNNACLMALLGIASHEPFAEARGRPIGRYGRLPVPTAVDELAARLGAALGSTPLVFRGGPGEVRAVGAISGAGGREIGTAAALGLDCFVTGEPEEDLPYLAAELGVHAIAAGHHATETLGVRAVAARLERDLGLETVYLPVENPV